MRITLLVKTFLTCSLNECISNIRLWENLHFGMFDTKFLNHALQAKSSSECPKLPVSVFKRFSYGADKELNFSLMECSFFHPFCIQTRLCKSTREQSYSALVDFFMVDLEGQVSSLYCLVSNHIKRWIFVPSHLECLLKKSWPEILLLYLWMQLFTTRWAMPLCLWPMWRMPITQLDCWRKPRYGTSWVPKVYKRFLATERVSLDPCRPSSMKLPQHGVSKSSE